MKSYRKIQEENAVSLLRALFNDLGNGIFRGKKRSFVLNNADLNLYPDIMKEAKRYFDVNDILWWPCQRTPSGHLLSSQISCINHLYFSRDREDVATEILRNIIPETKRAVMVESGFVEFEVIGKDNYLKESSHKRGRNSTSLDAVMIAELKDNKKILVAIEWKYIERYYRTSLKVSKAGTSRVDIYKPFLEEKICPILTNNIESLFYNPFDQLMRQVLLINKMVLAKEYGVDDWIHIHLVPLGNMELRNKNTSNGLVGEDMSKAWKSILKDPQKYKVICPLEIVKAMCVCKGAKPFIDYLLKRYYSDIK